MIEIKACLSRKGSQKKCWTSLEIEVLGSSKEKNISGKKSSKAGPELEPENPSMKALDDIVERMATENRALKKILKEINKDNKEN